MLLPVVHRVSDSVSWLGPMILVYFYSVTHSFFPLLRVVGNSTALLIYPLRSPFYTRVITPHYF